MLFFLEEDLVLEDVAIRGSSSASGDSVATSGNVGSTGGVGADGMAADAGVGIGGSIESEGLMCLSMMREKYINSFMLCNWVMILSCFKSCCSCFSLMARSSDLKNDWTAKDEPQGCVSVATPASCSLLLYPKDIWLYRGR